MNSWFAAAAAGVLTLLGGHASSTEGGHPPIGPGDHATSTREIRHEHDYGQYASTTLSTAIPCISAAVAARETSIDVAVSTYTTGVSAAYTARATALASAYTGTSNAAIRAAVKAAWLEFTGANRAARKGWQSSRESAWTAFRTAVKACGGSATTISDSGNAGSEMSGQ